MLDAMGFVCKKIFVEKYEAEVKKDQPTIEQYLSPSLLIKQIPLS